MRRFRFARLFLILASTVVLAKSNPVPLINQPLVPTSVAPGSGGFTLTVNGAAFVSGSLVYWNGSVRSTTFLSSHQIQAQISAADVANANTAWVSVRNPIPGGGLSNIVYFQVQSPVLGLGFRNGSQFSGVFNNPIAGDFNGDGKLDVVMVGGANQDTIEVFPGNGDGTFGQPIATTRKGWIWIMNQMTVGDFNNDGKLDLAVGEAISTSRHININMAILLGNGDGTFRHNKSGTIVQRGARPFATVDYDGDGNLDLYSAGERPPLGGYSWAMATEHLSSRELRSEVFTRRSVILMEMGRWIWQ